MATMSIKRMLVFCAVAAAGCGDDRPSSSSGPSPEVCSVGASLICFDCGGKEGKQHCLADGSGYGACECPNHCDVISSSCDSCQSCANENACSEPANRCFENQACVAILNCTDTASLWDCAQKFPSGADDFVAFGKCIFCDACPNNCQSTGWCDNDCVTKCALKFPFGVNDGIATASCLACDACTADCANICDNTGKNSCSIGSCSTCMTGNCAASSCAQELASCNVDCQSFANCIINTCN